MRRSVSAVLALAALGAACGAEGGGTSPSPRAPPATAETSDAPESERERLPPPRDGWRYESYHDVVVQVPESWGYAHAPTTAWCIAESLPTEPYVDTSRPYDSVEGIGCPGLDGPQGLSGIAVPKRHWATHLSFDAPGGKEGTRRDGTWTRIDRTVGATTITMLFEKRHADEARAILDSARQMAADHHGCDASSPIQAGEFARPAAAFDVGSLASVDSISVCQYDLGREPGTPGLMGSRQIEGADAAGLLDAIKQAPTGGGPDEPQNCSEDMFGSTAVVLRLHGDATNDMHVYYEWCFGNGFDDGTNIRELTKANCIPLFAAPPVKYDGGSSAPFQRCHEDVYDPTSRKPVTTATGG